MPNDFTDILIKKLSRIHEAARLAFVADPKPLLTIPKQLDDRHGNVWKVYRYDGNDLELRLRWKDALKNGEKLLVHSVPRPNIIAGSKPIVFSFIGDLIAAASEIIDFSPQSVLKDIYPNVLPPALYEEPLIGLWSRDIDAFMKNLSQYRKLSGRTQVLDRYDAFAISLATAHPELATINDFADLPYEPVQRVRSYLRFVLTKKFDDETKNILASIFAGSDDEQIRKRWTSINTSNLRRMLYVVLIAQRYLIPNPLVAVRGHALLDFDSRGLEKDIDDVTIGFNRDNRLLSNLAELIENTFTEREIAQLVEDFKFGSHQDIIQSLAKESSPLISLSLIRNFLVKHLVNDATVKVFATLDCSVLESREVQLVSTKFAGLAERSLSLLIKIVWLEKVVVSIPEISEKNLRSLIDTYYSHKVYLLDYTLAEIAEHGRLWKDPDLQSIIDEYVKRKRLQIDTILQKIDTVLADTITSDWKGYAGYARLNTRILRDILQPGLQRKGTVWIIVFDGLRLDSWESIVWPKLKQYFRLDGDFNLYLSTLPSYTNISRVAFFAGSTPPLWKDYNNKFTDNHHILLPKLLGLSREEAKTKLQIIARTEEKVEQQEFSLGQFQYTALIFNISDTWIHTEKGSLIQVNETIKRKLETLVLPDLENLIGPDDEVIVTSDHGFIELKEQYRITVDDHRDWNDYKNEYESPVYYRYLKGIEHPSGRKIQYDSNTFWTLPVGFDWYDRPKGKPARYSHGGISLSEMLVPGIMLKKIVDRQIVLEMAVDTVPECMDGEEIELGVMLSNRGSLAVDVNLSVYASGSMLWDKKFHIEADSSSRSKIKFEASTLNSALTIEVRFIDHKNTPQSMQRNVNLVIKESERVKIDTSALDVFDNQ